mmetsp:Transcript_11869/g.19592  ORF Transcript_11869/g.19592 Transcript_11869/m.19592 type:complete len:105 (-) Transcript_11869:44-358(-)
MIDAGGAALVVSVGDMKRSVGIWIEKIFQSQLSTVFAPCSLPALVQAISALLSCNFSKGLASCAGKPHNWKHNHKCTMHSTVIFALKAGEIERKKSVSLARERE